MRLDSIRYVEDYETSDLAVMIPQGDCKLLEVC